MTRLAYLKRATPAGRHKAAAPGSALRSAQISTQICSGENLLRVAASEFFQLLRHRGVLVGAHSLNANADVPPACARACPSAKLSKSSTKVSSSTRRATSHGMAAGPIHSIGYQLLVIYCSSLKSRTSSFGRYADDRFREPKPATACPRDIQASPCQQPKRIAK